MQDLSHLHKEIARLEVSGHSVDDIVASLTELGLSKDYIQRLRSNPVYQHFVKRLSDSADKECKDVRKKLIEKAADMLDVVIDMAEDINVAASTRLRAAQDILDRAGYKPIAKEVHLNVHEAFTPEERRSLRELHDTLKYSGFVLDITPQDGVPASMLEALPSGEDREQ